MKNSGIILFTISLLILILFVCFVQSNCNTFDKQQYHFEQNMKLSDSLSIISDEYLDSANKFTYLGIKNKNSKQLKLAQSFIDSVKKYDQITLFITRNITIPSN